MMKKKKKKNMNLMAYVVSFLLLAVVCYLLLSQEGDKTVVKPDVKPPEVKETPPLPEPGGLEALRALQEAPTDTYIDDLKKVVQENQDQYVRERAVFTMSDIALERDDSEEIEEVVGFLTGIANDEENDDVRTAAYAKIDLIRDVKPMERKGRMKLSVEGDLKDEFFVVVTVMSEVDIEDAIIVTDRLHKNLDLLSKPIQYSDLEANVPKVLRFKLKAEKDGIYEIPVKMMMSFNRVEYEEVRKSGFLIITDDEAGFVEW